MPFWRPEFIILLFSCLLALRLAPETWRKSILTVTGLYFYAWWDLRFLPLITGAALADWALGLWIDQARGKATARGMFLFGLALHLGMLAFFKYAGLLLPNGADGATSIIMPLGLSFQTFSAITYLAAVHSGRMAPRRNPLDVLCFATFFPVLSAGPIVRAEELLPQLDKLKQPNADMLYDGFRRFSMGLFKKLVLADHLGMYVAEVFDNAGAYDIASSWAAVLAYALQIYLDFSAYTDMAVGAARAIGVRLPENFSFPYASANPSEFWRRWHMSLSFWFRDYVYIPLGGSRLGTSRTLANLMAVMLLCGVWHGTGWTFVVWGSIHGIALCTHRLWKMVWPGNGNKPGQSWLACALFIALSWIPFRADNLGHAWRIVKSLFAGGPAHWIHPVVWCALAAVMLAQWLYSRGREELLMLRGPRWYAPTILFSMIWCAALFAAEGFTPFLYAKF